MALYLVQHGKSLPKETDPEQGLSERGRTDVARIADVAGQYGVRPAGIYHSGKKRARQTAEMFAGALKPPRGCDAMEGLKPLDDVVGFSQRIDEAQDTMLVGHLPFMQALTAYLITGKTDITVFKFQNGGIVCLDKDPGQTGWYIKWALMPNID